MRMKHLLLSLLVTVMLCGACTSKYQREFESGPADYGSRESVKGNAVRGDKMYGLQIRGGNNHNNTVLQYNQHLSDVVGGLEGVKASIVMLTDRNAYVAVVIDQSATGTVASRRSRETDNTGNSRGMYNTFTGSSYADPNKLATGTNSYYTSYDHSHLSSEFKQRIAETVRKINPGVLEVHISANRDFINQMNVYAIDARKGQSLQGYVEQFNQIATHHFGIRP